MTAPLIKVVTDRPEHFEAFGWTEFANLWDALQALDNFQEYVEIDTETTGLRSFLQDRIFSVQLGNPGGIFVFDIDGMTKGIRPLKSLIESKVCYFHNAAFDLPHLFHNDIVPKRIYDTLVWENVCTMGIRIAKRRLQDLAMKYLEVDIDKSQQTRINKGFDSIDSVMYAGTDVMYLWNIAQEQQKFAKQWDLLERGKHENLFTRVMAYMEWSGILLHQNRLHEKIREAEAREWLALKKLKDNYGKEVNWASPQQVIPILKEHGVEELHKKTKKPTKDVKSIIKHKDKVPLVAALIEYSEAAKDCNAFGRRWLHFIQSDGRVHTRYKQFTAAGRTSCGNLVGKKGEDSAKKFDPFNINYVETRPFPNIQQIPRKGGLRACFIPKKTNDFVITDYSSQESVIMAEMSGDPNMIAFFETGSGDLHSYTARLIYKELLGGLTDKEIQDNHKELRTNVKSGNFAIAYGGNEYTIAQNLNIPVPLAKEVYDGIMAVFTRLKPYFEECMAFTDQYGYIPIDPVGGKRFIYRGKEFCALANNKAYWKKYYAERDMNTSWYQEEVKKNMWYFELRKKLRKECVNSRIQGYAAFMSKLAGIYILDYIEKKGYWGKVLIPLFVHDEYVLENPKALTPEITKMSKDMMELAGSRTLKRLKIKADPKTGDMWSK